MDDGEALPALEASLKLVAYLRVSTEKQAKEGISLEAQEARIRAYAAAVGHEVVEVCRDDGASGARSPSDRSGLTRALWRVEKAEASEEGGGGALEGDVRGLGLAVTSLSRLSRSVRDILDLVDRSRARGFHLISLSESLDTSTATGRMVVGVLAVLAQFERELIGERTAEAMSKLRGDGKVFSGIPPYGYLYRDGRMEPVEREQKVIEFVTKRLEAGWPHGLIAQALNASAFLTRTGKPWDYRAVARVIRALERAR